MIELYLPERFAGFTEVDYDPGNRRHVYIEAFEVTQSCHITPDKDRIWTRWFVPPKPVPKLPNVTPGSVIRYTNKAGHSVRAVFHGNDKWDLYENLRIGFSQTRLQEPSYLLNDVDENGFTVELLGL
jgi:hypothetical protein